MRRNLLNPRTARPSVPVLRTTNRATLVNSAPGAPGTVAPGAPGTVAPGAPGTVAPGAPGTVAPVVTAPIVTESNDGLIYCFRGSILSATEIVATFFASLRLQFLGLPQTTIFNKIYFNWNIETDTSVPVSQFYSVNAVLLPIFRSTDAVITATSGFTGQVLNVGDIVLPKGQELGVFLPISSFNEFAQVKVTIARDDLTILNAASNFSCSLVLLFKR